MSANRQHSLIDPGARSGLIAEMREVLEVAKKLSCKNIMMLSDVLASDGSAAIVPLVPADAKPKSIVEGLRVLSGLAEAARVTLLLEPLNTRLDHPGCFLNNSALAVDVVRQTASPHVKVLYDIYHMHMMGEDVLGEIERNMAWIGYIHVADSPGRHQPGTGEIDFAAVAELLDRLKYRGFVGMEFASQGSSDEAVRTPLELFGRFISV
jgi:hydroxypyruvate isomerase